MSTKIRAPRWARVRSKAETYGAVYGGMRLRIERHGAAVVHSDYVGGGAYRSAEWWEAEASVWIGGDIEPIRATEKAHHSIDSRAEAERAALAAARRLAKWIKKTAARLAAGGHS